MIIIISIFILFSITSCTDESSSGLETIIHGNTNIRPAWSPDGSKIAFLSRTKLTHAMKINIINADGSNPQILTDPVVSDEYSIKWSPDGVTIVYETYLDSPSEIWKVNADGSNNVKLSENSLRDRFPDWSPNAEKIVYSSKKEIDSTSNFFLQNEIYIMNTDGSHKTRLTFNSTHDTYPYWSPSGSKISFISRLSTSDAKILIMNTDGSNQELLDDNSIAYLYNPWSFDSNKLLYFTPGNNMWVINADGSQKNQISNIPDGIKKLPVWSPNGWRILFCLGTNISGLEEPRNPDENYEIYVVNSDGTDLQQLTNDDYFNLYPAWSPDGLSIAYASDGEIWTMNSDGTSQTRLTYSNGNEKSYHFQPEL